MTRPFYLPTRLTLLFPRSLKTLNIVKSLSLSGRSTVPPLTSHGPPLLPEHSSVWSMTLVRYFPPLSLQLLFEVDQGQKDPVVGNRIFFLLYTTKEGVRRVRTFLKREGVGKSGVRLF